MKRADLNRDGLISYQEFMSYIKKYESQKNKTGIASKHYEPNSEFNKIISKSV